jgi:hypothetical protein
LCNLHRALARFPILQSTPKWELLQYNSFLLCNIASAQFGKTVPICQFTIEQNLAASKKIHLTFEQLKTCSEHYVFIEFY